MKCLIVEGGGFKSGFTSGVLDSMLINGYNPFDSFYGISGGSVSLSYYLSNQYRSCFSALLHLIGHPRFTNFRRVFQSTGYMNIDFIKEVSKTEFPLDSHAIVQRFDPKFIHIVLTNKETGQAEYINPSAENWMDLVIASCSLPFVTKGEHVHGAHKYFDGGWGDALPVIEAYNNGAKKIVIVRTWVSGEKATQSWVDYFGSIYYRSNPVLSELFNSSFKKYNEAIEFIQNPPSDLEIIEIAPDAVLQSGTYVYSTSSVTRDYRYGLDLGMQFLAQL